MGFKINKKFNEFSSKISWITFILVVVFSFSSWICSTSLWAQLPVIVYEVDEGWRLPSILTVIAQLGQIFPALIYPILKSKNSGFIKNRTVIYIKLVTEIAILATLVFIWNKTILIGSEQRAIGLYLVFFWLSLFDGLSVVSYLPFIQEYLENEYIISSYIGESFSSLIPSTITFIQGANDDAACQNISGNSSILMPLKPRIKFSTELYFILILVFMILASVSFVVMNLFELKPASEKAITQAVNEQTKFIKNIEPEKVDKSSEKLILLSCGFIMCFLMFGVLLGLQSYSTLPYSHEAFHLSINLGNLFLPLAVFISIWSYDISLFRFLAEFVLGVVLSGYIVFVSIYSPCPPFVDHWLGSWLVVSAWILAECIFTRLRCLLASKLEKFKDERLLVILGSLSLLGQITGGVLIYLLVDVFRFFKHKPECVFDLSYCE